MVTKAAMTTGMEMTAKEHIKKSLFFFSLLVSPLPAFCFELPKDFWLLRKKKNFEEEAVIGANFLFFWLLFPHTHVYKILLRYSHIPISYTMILR